MLDSVWQEMRILNVHIVEEKREEQKSILFQVEFWICFQSVI